MPVRGRGWWLLGDAAGNMLDVHTGWIMYIDVDAHVGGNSDAAAFVG